MVFSSLATLWDAPVFDIDAKHTRRNNDRAWPRVRPHSAAACNGKRAPFLERSLSRCNWRPGEAVWEGAANSGWLPEAGMTGSCSMASLPWCPPEDRRESVAAGGPASLRDTESKLKRNKGLRTRTNDTVDELIFGNTLVKYSERVPRPVSTTRCTPAKGLASPERSPTRASPNHSLTKVESREQLRMLEIEVSRLPDSSRPPPNSP